MTTPGPEGRSQHGAARTVAPLLGTSRGDNPIPMRIEHRPTNSHTERPRPVPFPTGLVSEEGFEQVRLYTEIHTIPVSRTTNSRRAAAQRGTGKERRRRSKDTSTPRECIRARQDAESLAIAGTCKPYAVEIALFPRNEWEWVSRLKYTRRSCYDSGQSTRIVPGREKTAGRPGEPSETVCSN